jgi:hypothetical protein
MRFTDKYLSLCFQFLYVLKHLGVEFLYLTLLLPSLGIWVISNSWAQVSLLPVSWVAWTIGKLGLYLALCLAFQGTTEVFATTATP